MKSAVTFSSGVAISKNSFYLASALDELDHYDYYSRMFVYRHIDDVKWSCHDLDGWGMVSTAFETETEQLLTVNPDGDLEIYVDNNKESKIESILSDQFRDTVYVGFNRIKSFSFGTYTCGDGGQIYWQENNKKWESISYNLADPLLKKNSLTKDELLDLNHTFGYDTYLYDIEGTSRQDLYVCGSRSDRGFIAYFTGQSWVSIEVKTPSTLNNIILCNNQSDVYVIGQYGTLLKGNNKTGFKNLKDMTINSTFYSGEFYQDILYIASEDGLYTYENNSFKKVEALKGLKGTFYVEEKEGVLWVLSYKNLIRFDGYHWEIIHHPDNEEEETLKRLKCYAGERCPQSGEWYSTANQMQKRHFKQGDMMPEIENNVWGETIWYMDQ